MTYAKRILVVDDEEPNRQLLQAMLQALGHETEIARDGLEALAKLRLDIDLVLLDVMMPAMDGFEVAKRIRQDPQVGDVPIVMVTALSGKEHRLRAVEVGANDYITKPIDAKELQIRTTCLLKLKESQDAIKRHQRELEETLQKRTVVLRQALQETVDAQRAAHEAHLDTIHRLAVAAEYKDEDTACHIQRMSRYCALLARSLHLPPGEVETVEIASPMHDVGKIGIPDAILLKPGRLDEGEWQVMKQHAIIGGRILDGSISELLRAGRAIALSHHERWDGSGYPNGLAGDEIPLHGRLCAVADVFDALTSNRPYRRALPNEDALRILAEGRGKHFDPRVLDAFTDNLDEVFAIQKELQDGQQTADGTTYLPHPPDRQLPWQHFAALVSIPCEHLKAHHGAPYHTEEGAHAQRVEGPPGGK